MKVPLYRWLPALLAAWPLSLHAQPALVPDPGFLPVFTQPGAHVESVAVQNDGRIYIAGTFTAIDGVPRSHVARLNASGGLDSSFLPELPAVEGEATALALQPDGKLIVGGRLGSAAGSENRVVRLNPDGSLDASFSPDHPFAGGIAAIALQPDGRILTSEAISDGRGPRLRRLINTGATDPSFAPAVGAGDPVTGLVVQPDGKILVWGCFTRIGESRSGLVRLNPDGSLDPSFRYQLEPAFPEVGATCFSSLALLPDGRLLVGGYFRGGGLFRLRADGALDTGFFSQATAYAPRPILVQPDGRLILGHNSGGATFRLQGNGTLDTGFPPDSTIGPYIGTALALQGGNQLLVFHEDQVKRMKSNGAPDPSFAPTLLGQTAQLSDAFAQSDGRLIVAGNFSHVNGVARQSLARLNPDGTPDEDFVPPADLPALCLPMGLGCQSLIRQQPTDGKLILGALVGFAEDSTPVSTLIRLNEDGSHDPTFTSSITDWPIVDLAFQADGKPVVIYASHGWTAAASNTVVRLHADGTRDPGFQWAGIPSKPMAMAVQADGKLLIGGLHTPPDGTGHLALVRLDADGSADAGFAPAIPDFGWNYVVQRILLQPDGKLTISAPPHILRLNPDGTLDPSFGSGTPVPGVVFADSIHRIAPVGDQGLILCGDIRYLDSRFLFDDGTAAPFVLLDGQGRLDRRLTPSKLSDEPPACLIPTVVPMPNGGFVAVGGCGKVAGFTDSFGLARFRPTPIIQSAGRNASGEFSLRVGGQLGWVYRLESSTDLEAWSLLGEFLSAGLTTDIGDEAWGAEGFRFFRVSLRP